MCVCVYMDDDLRSAEDSLLFEEDTNERRGGTDAIVSFVQIERGFPSCPCTLNSCVMPYKACSLPTDSSTLLVVSRFPSAA